MYNRDFSIEITIGKWIFDTSFTWRFGAGKPKPSRITWGMGIRGAYPSYTNRSVLLQIYRPGTDLDWHQDGGGISNRVFSWVFWKPQRGGDLEVRGVHKQWWRFHWFDGGISEHRVTKCEGYRGVLMFQHGQKMTEEQQEADIKSRRQKKSLE